MRTLRKLLHTAHTWSCVSILGGAMMILGWARTYPVTISPAQDSLLNAVAPIFWTGLLAVMCGLGGIASTSRSTIGPWAASALLVVSVSAPQLLFLSWGSDTGMLLDFVEYVDSAGGFVPDRDIAVESYFQWPGSIVFQQFLGEALAVSYIAANQISFVMIAFAVGAGLHLIWYRGIGSGTEASRAAFWGTATHIIAFFWVLNWQMVPYVFMLALFLPMVAILREARTLRSSLAVLLLFAAGIEVHALFGVWAILVAGVGMIPLVAVRWVRPRPSLMLAMGTVYLALLVYKNTRFLRYVAATLQGYYQELLELSLSDKSIVHFARLALTPLPGDTAGALLKALSWLDLILVAIAIGVSLVVVVTRRRFSPLVMSLFVAGCAYFLLGTKYPAIGARSLQLIAALPSFAVAIAFPALSGQKHLRMLLAVLCWSSLLLFLAPIMRAFSTSPNYVRASDLYLKSTIQSAWAGDALPEMILSEHNRPLDPRTALILVSTRQLRHGSVDSCRGPIVVADTPQLRQELLGMADGGRSLAVELIGSSPVFYDSGELQLRYVNDCSALQLPGLPR